MRIGSKENLLNDDMTSFLLFRGHEADTLDADPFHERIGIVAWLNRNTIRHVYGEGNRR